MTLCCILLVAESSGELEKKTNLCKYGWLAGCFHCISALVWVLFADESQLHTFHDVINEGYTRFTM